MQESIFFGGSIAFGRTVGAAVLAESIETEGQLEELIALGLTQGQGFLLGPPLEWEAFDGQSSLSLG